MPGVSRTLSCLNVLHVDHYSHIVSKITSLNLLVEQLRPETMPAPTHRDMLEPSAAHMKLR